MKHFCSSVQEHGCSQRRNQDPHKLLRRRTLQQCNGLNSLTIVAKLYASRSKMFPENVSSMKP